MYCVFFGSECKLCTMNRKTKNGYGFLRAGLKTGKGNGIFWSEIGYGFGDAGGTPPPKNPRSTPPGLIQALDVRLG